MKNRTTNRLRIIIYISVLAIAAFISYKVYINKSSDITIKIATEIKTSEHVVCVPYVDMNKVKNTDFKEIKLQVQGINHLLRKNVSIKIDDLSSYLDNKNGIKSSVPGSSFDYPDGMQYEKNAILYCPGSSKEDIKNMLKEYKIKVEWQNWFGKKYLKTVYLKKC